MIDREKLAREIFVLLAGTEMETIGDQKEFCHAVADLFSAAPKECADDRVAYCMGNLRNRVCRAMGHAEPVYVAAAWRAFFRLEQRLADIGVLEAEP